MPTTDPVKRKVIVSSYQKRNAWRLNRERLLKKLLGKASDATGGKDGKVALYRGTWNWNVWKQSLGMSPMPYTPRPSEETLRKYGIRVKVAPGDDFLMLTEPVLAEEEGKENKYDSEQVELPDIRDDIQDKIDEGVIKPYTFEYVRAVERALTELKEQDLQEAWTSGVLLDYLKTKFPNPNSFKKQLVGLNLLREHGHFILDDEASIAFEAELKRSATEAEIFQLYKTIDENKSTNAFSKIMQTAMEHVNGDSEEAVLIHLYDELTLRNDYEDVWVYKTLPTEQPKDKNFYIRASGKLYFNAIKKTGDKYLDGKTFEYQVSERTRKVIDLSLQNYPREKLISVSPPHLLKAMGTSVNRLRHAKIVEELHEIESKDKRRELAKKMFHSVATQHIYTRPLRGDRLIATKTGETWV